MNKPAYSVQTYIDLIVVTTMALLVYIMVFFFPMPWWQKWVGKPVEIPRSVFLSSFQLEIVQSLRRSIRRTKKFHLAKFTCLTEAIVLKCLFARKTGIHLSLYMGINKQENRMNAHAWLMAGDKYIAGGKGSKHFNTVVIFE